MKVYTECVWVLLLPMLLACDNNGKKIAPPEAGAGPHVRIGGERFDVALINTEAARRHATDGFEPLPGRKGYLLAWPRERFPKIESQDCPGSFDVAFLDRAGKVVDLRALKAGAEEGIQPAAECAYALFLPSGAAPLKTGGTVDLSPEVKDAAHEDLPALKVGGHVVHAELSITGPERNHGLMHRTRMSAEDGMLFGYPSEVSSPPLSFWMKNTLIPLDIAFFREDGTLVNVREMQTYPDPRHPPHPYPSADAAGPARFVLEMQLGWFRRKGLIDASGQPRPGVKAELPPEAFKSSH